MFRLNSNISKYFLRDYVAIAMVIILVAMAKPMSLLDKNSIFTACDENMIFRKRKKSRYFTGFYVIRRFNIAVNSYFLPQFFVFSFYFLAVTRRDSLYHCKRRIFDGLFERGFKGTLRFNIFGTASCFSLFSCLPTQHLVSVTDFVTSLELCEVFITNEDILRFFVINVHPDKAGPANVLFVNGMI